ncbi:NFX1-type zinc finger-containing protein 1-like, partial [Orbicella faveolata]|uniref:NFX1-type zinc finger-containing protein 1-like n=1 Tax=Orbicella faveolata TaxID=48498 RepID=UPI0009E6586C
YGSFLCLSKDNFETMLFATVANRDPRNLQKGTFDIQFIEEQNILDIEKRQQEYQMVESPAFFEACRHVLKGLKGMNADNIPFTKYLVECSDKVDPPEYLVRGDGQDPVCYDLSKALGVRNSPTSKKVPVLNPEAWPSVDILPLNGSQLEALRTALTTEFSVIQGPPGTGKTYVGAKIVRCLLENRQQWDPENVSPMLMVCYTNHALDQFLEKVLEFLPKRAIIRVGGRSKSEKLEDCNLKVFTKKYRRNYAHGCKLEEMEENQREMDSDIEHCEKLLTKADKVLLEFRDLEDVMTSRHADQLYGAIFPRNATSNCQNPTNTFKLWLCNNTQMNDANQHASTLTESHKDGAQDGSVLQEDYADEDDDVLYHAAGERFEGNSISHILQDEVVSLVEQSLQEMPKENTTTEDTETVSGKSPSRNTKDTNQLDANTSSLNGSPMSYPRNVEWEPSVNEDLLSNTKNGEQCNNEELQQSQQDDLQITVSKEIEEPIVAKQVEEESQLLNEDNDAVSESLKTSEGKSNAEEMNPHDPSEETITVEDEAAWIQSQRYIEGEEEHRLVRVQQSDKGKRKEENEVEVTENSAEWKTVIYQKNPKPFFWRKEEGGTIRDDIKGQLVEAEDGQRGITATKKRKKKKKKTENKINMTANIVNIRRQLQQEAIMPSDEALAVENIWCLSAKDRLRLYLYWIECYRERQRIEIQRCKQRYEQKHKELCVELEEIKAQDEEEVIRRATVVGMTTSVAARYHTMLQRISPKIVIIEEAAEVLEAHIITSLSRNTKHTILIGDHKQLRPKATVYELAQKYNLEISLFERMVLNSMDCKRLCIQHRMRPEIAALTKRIYEHEIVDHESVCAFEDISGLRHNMFFIDHNQPEVPVRGLQSFSNPHEAGFLVALCRYLLLQGYKREQITILTMYTGQLLELQSRMPRREFEGIKVCVVDNFQGEENDIILLSLVRSSKIGFLKESNRICVALSRARQGFYCIGNFSLLKSQCILWKEICDDLETKNAIGQILTLVCKRHSNVNQARDWRDIQKFPLGGCEKVCGVRLDCGHACDRACHPTDDFHLPGRCPKVCWKSCANDHQCQKRCHYPDGCFCARPMVKIIPRCGHEQTVQCCIEPEDFTCQVKCEKSLKCGHRCKNICGRACTMRCYVECNKTLPCGHETIMPCFKDPIIYNQCYSNCDKILDCGHPCSKKCKDRCRCNTTIEVKLPCSHGVFVLCPEKSYPPPCFKKCTRKLLACGHECPGLCYEECSSYRCEILVEKLLPCDHKQILPCHFDPRYISCHEMCQRKCNRGHPCQQRCHFGFPCKDCQVMVNMTIPSCNHNIEMPCHLDPTALVCKKPCERVRTCGHPCRDVCGKNCEARPCMKLVPRTLPCGHTVTLACNKSLQTYKCKVKVVVDLSCGHKKAMDCCVEEAGLQNVKCNEKVDKELPCKHKAILQCHTNPEEYKC